MNESTMPHSRLPYQHFQVDIALQVGGEVGPFVSDGGTIVYACSELIHVQ